MQWEDGSTTPKPPLSRLREHQTGGPSANEATPAGPLPALPASDGTQDEVLQTTDVELGDAVDQGLDEASFLGSLSDGDLRVKGAPSVYALPPSDDGTWHPLVHDLAPIVMEALRNLELLFEAKCHSTGVASRYVGRFYTGEGKRTLLVVEAYVPVSTYNPGASSAAYAHDLGRRAGEYTGGVAKTRWQAGDPMPNPTRNQIAHPKRLMMADLALHLRAYADNPHCTVVLMGDMNVDRDRDQGTEDAASLEMMLTALHIRSCADIRWGPAARQIATRSEGTSSSHIDHVFITDTAATSVDEFAVDEDSGLGTGHGDERGLDHNVLVIDFDVRSLLGIGIDAKRLRPRSDAQLSSTVTRNESNASENTPRASSPSATWTAPFQRSSGTWR